MASLALAVLHHGSAGSPDPGKPKSNGQAMAQRSTYGGHPRKIDMKVAWTHNTTRLTSIQGILLALSLTASLAGCAQSPSGKGFQSPKALAQALHHGWISGDYKALLLCVEPAYRDRFARQIPLLRRYTDKVRLAERLIERKCGRKAAEDFGRKHWAVFQGSPFAGAVKDGRIQWSRTDIRIRGDRAWIVVDRDVVLQAVRGPKEGWYMAFSDEEVSSEACAHVKGMIESGIAEIEGVIGKVESGQMWEREFRRWALDGQSIILPATVELIIEAEATELLKGTKVVQGNAVRMLSGNPYETGGFIASITVEKELKDLWIYVVYSHDADGELAISIDGGKPIKVGLPKTEVIREYEYKWAIARLESLAKGEHRVHVYPTHDSGVAALDMILFVRKEAN